MRCLTKAMGKRANRKNSLATSSRMSGTEQEEERDCPYAIVEITIANTVRPNPRAVGTRAVSFGIRFGIDRSTSVSNTGYSTVLLLFRNMMGGYTVMPNGLLFGANASGKTYISLYQHRGNGSRQHKSKWSQAFGPMDEHALFCLADMSTWQDAAGRFWAVHNGGGTIIGERGEVLCKFPTNGNVNVPWHGYPVSPADERDGDCPPDDFVEAWWQSGAVSKTLARRIQKRKI
jgi:hypothetical protein